MIEELLRRFSRENFGDANYVPLLRGRSETAKPLSLMIKQKTPIWKLPFAKNETIILDGLENFVSRDCEKEYLEAVKLSVIEQVLEKGKNAPVYRYKRINEILPWKSKIRKFVMLLIANFTINCVSSFADHFRLCLVQTRKICEDSQ